MNKKKYIILSIIILVIVLGLGITYAWYVWSSSDDEVTSIAASLGVARVIYDEGSDVEGDIMPVATKEEGIIKNITVKAIDETSVNITFNLYLDALDLPDVFKHESFRYAIYKDNTTLIKEGNFTETFTECTVNSTTHIVLLENQSITTTTSTYTLYLWIDGENYTNPSEMQNKYIKLKLHADGRNANIYDGTVIVPINAVEHITNLYNLVSKREVINNGITYNYASAFNLMNDRLGGTTTGLDTGNIRYYGATPNNYIDIGDVYAEDTTFNNWELKGRNYDSTERCYEVWDCDTYYADWGYDTVEACYEGKLYSYGMSSVEEMCGTTTYTKGTPILYRIIGLFKDVELADGSKKDLIKVIRDESIGRYSWDTSASEVNDGIGINEWSGADLMKLLNPGYENNMDLDDSGSTITVNNSLWWNSGSGVCYNDENNATTSCDFTGSGLSSNVKDKIESVVWNLGGHDDEEVYSNQIYEHERGTNVVIPGITCSGTYCNDTVTRTTKWTGKVALMYPSDYGYATDFNSCSSDLYYYDDDGCYNNDWLYNGTHQWLLSPHSSRPTDAWYVEEEYVDTGDEDLYYHTAVRPAFYLNSEATIVSGDGSKANPYKVS